MLIFIALTKLYIIWFCHVKEVKDRPAEISCFCSRIILFPKFKSFADMAYNIFKLTNIFVVSFSFKFKVGMFAFQLCVWIHTSSFCASITTTKTPSSMWLKSVQFHRLTGYMYKASIKRLLMHKRTMISDQVLWLVLVRVLIV